MPDEVFVIMQIGDGSLDEVYETSIAPAIRSCDLTPRRIDLDNEGGLLTSEILHSITQSAFVVADLTNERPNCYLEVGYALGLGRQRELILTARRDHLPGQPGNHPDGPKVHFDLAGYDLLLWDADDLDGFRIELAKRIQRRGALLVRSSTAPTSATGPPWWSELRREALEAIHADVGPGSMEIAFELTPPKIEASARELLDAASTAQVRTFGWPIGVVLDSHDDRPRPTGNGIRARVDSTRWNEERSFDEWEILVNGDFFSVASLYEDQNGRPDALFFDTRAIRITEAILYCGRLYAGLDVSPDAGVRMLIRHGGLSGRHLTASSRRRSLSQDYQSDADASEGRIDFQLSEIAADLVTLVKSIAQSLFEVFDFFVLGDAAYEQIVNGFVAGRMP